MNKLRTGRLFWWLVRGCLAASVGLVLSAEAAGNGSRPLVVDDVASWQRFADQLGEGYSAGKTPPLVDLRKQMESRRRVVVELAKPARRGMEAAEVYERCSASVVALGSVYKCNRCPHWHTGGTGTGWVIGRSGEIVSNYHVFAEGRNTNVVAIGAMTRDGRCFPVEEVLAADRERDVVVVRIGARDLVPLAVSIHEPVGRPVTVIGHPSGELFTFTQGHISRYAKKAVEAGGRPLDWMCVTADFAIGSSGGPVFNDRGSVVGMVARTHTINADPKSEAPTTQMVVKMTIPAESILKLVESAKDSTRPKR